MSTKWSAEILGKGNVPNFGALLKDEYTVILLHGKNLMGQILYCYLKISFENLEKLQTALAGTASFNASDYGWVVAAGTGEPPAEIKAEIAANYTLLTKPPPASVPRKVIPEEKKAWDEY